MFILSHSFVRLWCALRACNAGSACKGKSGKEGNANAGRTKASESLQPLDYVPTPLYAVVLILLTFYFFFAMMRNITVPTGT